MPGLSQQSVMSDGSFKKKVIFFLIKYFHMYGCFACVYAMTLHHMYSRCPQNLRGSIRSGPGVPDSCELSCGSSIKAGSSARAAALLTAEPFPAPLLFLCGGVFIRMSVHHEDAVPVGARRGRWSYRLLSCKQALGILGPLEE